MREMGRTVLEACVVCGVGTVLALGANFASPKGLKLWWDYFPPPKQQPLTTTQARPPKPDPGEKVKLAGFTPIRHDGPDGVMQLFNDPLYQQVENGPYLFVDARNDQHYKEAHIPKAWHLDPFYPDRNIQNLLPRLQEAEKVILYCSGGDCEDSILAAQYLRDKQGIDPIKLLVDTDGMSGWCAKGLQVEKGERNSGELITCKLAATAPAGGGK